jgi:hypothetical protein
LNPFLFFYFSKCISSVLLGFTELQTKHTSVILQSLLVLTNFKTFAVATTLLTFVGLFRKAHDENLKQIEAEKKKAQKEAEKEATQDKTPVKSKNGNADKSPRSPSTFK